MSLLKLHHISFRIVAVAHAIPLKDPLGRQPAIIDANWRSNPFTPAVAPVSRIEPCPRGSIRFAACCTTRVSVWPRPLE